MLWCQGAQNTGLSNGKLISALKCTVWSQCTHVPDRPTDWRTDEHHGNSSTIRSTNASRAKTIKVINGKVYRNNKSGITKTTPPDDSVVIMTNCGESSLIFAALCSLNCNRCLFHLWPCYYEYLTESRLTEVDRVWAKNPRAFEWCCFRSSRGLNCIA